jgi:hypothetical protein
MIDLGEMAHIAVPIAAIAGLVLTLRWLGGTDGASLAELFRIPIDPPWPRGVQEEEPQRWRLERLSRSRIGYLRRTGADTARQAVDGSTRARLPLTD